MMRWKFTIEYAGTDYAGWQMQEGVPTLQQSVERAIHAFSGQTIRLHAAGRTDAGVHARGQVAHADFEALNTPMTGFEIAKAINAHLRAEPISITAADIVSPHFHARFSAVNKLYEYRILCRSAPPAIDRRCVWHIKKPLDIEAMRLAAQHLLGCHDFTSFRDSGCQAKSAVKTLSRLDIFANPYDGNGGVEIKYLTEGRSFLHHQVRNMVGSLVMVGQGKWAPEDIRRALEARDRRAAGPTAPPQGLCLVKIDYSK